MSQIYNNAKTLFLTGHIDWSNDSFKAILVKEGYSPDFTSDQYVSDISAGNRIAISDFLEGKTVVDGVADADDVVAEAVSSAYQVSSIVIFKYTGNNDTSPLIVYIDDSTNNMFPFTPNGGNIKLSWSNDSNKIFSL